MVLPSVAGLTPWARRRSSSSAAGTTSRAKAAPVTEVDDEIGGDLDGEIDEVEVVPDDEAVVEVEVVAAEDDDEKDDAEKDAVAADGDDDEEDVVIGRRVAERAGLDFLRVPPATPTGFDDDPVGDGHRQGEATFPLVGGEQRHRGVGTRRRRCQRQPVQGLGE